MCGGWSVAGGRLRRFVMLWWCVVQVPIPDHMDLYHLHEEAEPSDRTALEVRP